jgi:hypothetical protein
MKNTPVNTQTQNYLAAEHESRKERVIKQIPYKGLMITLVQRDFPGKEPLYRLQINQLQSDGSYLPWVTARDLHIKDRTAAFAAMAALQTYGSGMLAGNSNLILVGDTRLIASAYATQKMAWVNSQYDPQVDGVYVDVDGTAYAVAVNPRDIPQVGYASLSLVPKVGLTTTDDSKVATPDGVYWLKSGERVIKHAHYERHDGTLVDEDQPENGFKFWSLVTESAILDGVNISIEIGPQTMPYCEKTLAVFETDNVPLAVANARREGAEHRQIATAAAGKAESYSQATDGDVVFPLLDGGTVTLSQVRAAESCVFPVTRGGAPLPRQIDLSLSTAQIAARVAEHVQKGHTFLLK